MNDLRNFIGRLSLVPVIIAAGIWQAKSILGWQKHAQNTWPALGVYVMNLGWLAPIWRIFPQQPHQIAPFEMKFFAVAIVLHRLTGYYPHHKIISDTPHILKEILSCGRGAIVATPHYFINANSRLFHDEIGNRLVVLGRRYPKYLKWIAAGRQLDIDFVPSNSDCFLMLRQKLGQNKIVSMCPDYVSGKFSHKQVISDAIFRFSEKINVPLYFAKPRLLPDGTVVVTLQGSSSKGVAQAESFIAFQQPERQFKRV